MTSPIFVALDTADLEQARTLGRSLKGRIGGIKLGLEFFIANGPVGVDAVASLDLPIFLDLKLHDIPNTVAKAVAAIAPLRPAILTVHAAGGHAMLAAARAAAPEDMKVVAVTVLTSLDESDLSATGITGDSSSQVARLALLARDAGVDGIVCSGDEVATIRAQWPESFLVVPGIRPADAAQGDQKRVVTPRAARDAGASVIVIGRPITQAPDPAAAAKAVADSF